MTTLTEFKEIKAKQSVEHKRDEHGCESCNATKEVQRIAPKALPALIAVAEAMAEALNKGIELLEPFQESGFLGDQALNKHRQVLARFEAWKDNIEGEK